MGTQNDVPIHTQGESFLNISTSLLSKSLHEAAKSGNGNGNKSCNNTKTYSY